MDELNNEGIAAASKMMRYTISLRKKGYQAMM